MAAAACLAATYLAAALFSTMFLVAAAPADAQQPPDPMEILPQYLDGLPDLSALQIRPGTWSYPVREGWHISRLDPSAVGDRNGIDADFLKKSSVLLTRTVRGPDRCTGEPGSVSDLRILAMQPEPERDGQFLSRIVLDEERSRAALEVYGEVREWQPGPDYCTGGEQQMQEASRGQGRLRLQYRIQTFPGFGFLAHPPEGENPFHGNFLWPGGEVKLELDPIAPGAPVGQMMGPADGESVRQALQLGIQAGADGTMPTMEEIEAKMPEGMSLDSMPLHFVGQAAAGPSQAPHLREWMAHFVLEVVDDPTRVLAHVLDEPGPEPGQ